MITLTVSSEFSAFQPPSGWYAPHASDLPFEFTLRVLRITNYDHAAQSQTCCPKANVLPKCKRVAQMQTCRPKTSDVTRKDASLV